MSLKQSREKRRVTKEKRDAKRAHDEAVERVEQLEQELEAALRLQEATSIAKIVPAHSSGTSEAVAVVMASDWHVEELVDPKTVNGLNKYTPEIAKKRSEQFFQRTLRMIRKERQDVKIETLILWLGGDFFTNSLREENLESNAMRPVEAAIFAKELLGSGLSFLQNHLIPNVNNTAKIICVCSSGNHARVTKRIHVSTEHGNSLETFLYVALAKEHPQLEWHIEPGYNTYLQVFDKLIRFNHGHFVKYGGGVGGLTIPLLKALNGWDTQKRADLTCIGHWHQYLLHRRFGVNGSMIGFNPFAVSIKAEFEPPSQSFFLFDKKRGRTVNIPILFD